MGMRLYPVPLQTVQGTMPNRTLYNRAGDNCEQYLPMRLLFYLCVLLSLCIGIEAEESAWETRRLTADFYAEGATTADINSDGHVDLIYGPQWWAGPTFSESFRFSAGEPFTPDKGYSDSFFSFAVDANQDGKPDLLIYGFPGKEARLYINPGEPEKNQNWAMHPVAPEVSNESPAFEDIIPGGLPEIVCSRDETYGYYTAGEDPTQPWKWYAVSKKGEAGGRFEHGLGVGDINRDGRPDLVQRMYWYENKKGTGLWTRHRWSMIPQSGGAQILVDDIDGDGDSDLISSDKAHGYGLSWYEQYEPGKFQPHKIMGSTSQDNPFGVCFSQLHGLALVDIDGDGRNDIVTGKRYLAHQGKDPGGLEAPVLYWFRNTKTDRGVEFVPHFVDDDSGVGVEVKVADLNSDGRPDIISGSKRGLSIHLQGKTVRSTAEPRWEVPEGRPQKDYGAGLSPEESLARMEVPEGFAVDLIAAEPSITQPIAMTFDARGRLWVIEGHTYPQRAPEGEGKDRVVILEDTNGDGDFDSKKVFAEGLNLASGIEIGFGGVYIGAAPYFMFYPDRNQDDIPDSDPEILLDGWGYQDTHETLNAFTWGPDGWLYGCHGVFTHSKVGKPGTPDKDRQKLNAGIWRFHPVTQQFEVYAHGTSNPWGFDFNEYGDFFLTSCVIPHFYHLSHGGLYRRQAGQHFNPWAFDDIKTIADHSHYAGNIRDHAFWGARRTERPPPPADTSALGGGHAHCGLTLYQADEFPAVYRGAAFFHNLHGHRMVREKIEKKGSGYIARHRPDFLLTNDHNFVGVGVMQGSDGALYFSDWVDTQTCHHRDVEIWDRKNGRIFRVRYGDAKTTRQNLPEKSDTDLVALLGNRNAVIARQAQRLLQERSAGGKLHREKVAAALTVFEADNSPNSVNQLRALWTRHVTGLLSDELLAATFEHDSEYLRAWAVQLAPVNSKTLPKLEALAAGEDSLVVRRYLASKLQQMPLDSRWILAERLISHGRSGYDPNIPLLCWYGIEPLVELDSDRAFALAEKTNWPRLKDYISRRGVVTPRGRNAISLSLAKAKSADEFSRLASGLISALEKQPPVDQPENWSAAKKRGKQLSETNQAVSGYLSRLGVRFGDGEYFPAWRAIAQDEKHSPVKRSEALHLLSIGRDPELGSLARDLLSVPALRQNAIAALRNHPGKATADAIVPVIPEFPLNLRNEAINLLASRADMALPLLEAVDTGKLPSSLVSTVLLDQFDRFNDREISRFIDKNWVRGGGEVDLAQLHDSIKSWKAKLNPKVMAKADASRGRQIFTTTCGTCHQLFGEGVALGPDLTGSNRADLGYLLENVLAPGSVVGKDYMLNVFSMSDGSTLSGMIKAQTPEFYTLSMPGGATVDVRKTEVRKREELAQSLMPAGLFGAMPLEQVADLVKYLASARQVPLTGAKSAAPMSLSPVPPGVTRIEGEALAGKFHPNGGLAVAQAMSNFGPHWSGNKQLWWKGGKPGNILTLKLNGIKAGPTDITIFPTTARDYATAKFLINGQLQEVDFYTAEVLPGEPLLFRNVTISPTEPLQVDIHITGKNESAAPGYMIGIDRIEIGKPG